MTKAHEILSPLPGTFYRSPAPDQPPFKSEGDQVQIGDVIGLVEVMKQFSEVAAEEAGVLTSFHVQSGEPVDPGQLLATVSAE